MLGPRILQRWQSAGRGTRRQPECYPPPGTLSLPRSFRRFGGGCLRSKLFCPSGKCRQSRFPQSQALACSHHLDVALFVFGQADLQQISFGCGCFVFHLCIRLFRISGLAGNCSQAIDFRRFICIYLSRNGLGAISSVFQGPNWHTIHTHHTTNCHTLHTSMPDFCHTFHTSMKQAKPQPKACRDFKEQFQIRGLGADRGERHESLSSQEWFAQWRGMRRA